MFYGEGLVRGLKDADPEVRVRVANALRDLEDPRATMPLVEALGDPYGEVRRAAAWGLSWVGDERARPALIRALEDENQSVRLWSASGLRGLGDESAVEPLIQRLSDPYDSVREQAVLALARIGDRRAVESLIKALDDEDTQVRMAADSCLRNAFKIEYDPDTKQAKFIPEEKTVEFDALPPDERERIDSQLETVLKMIKNLEAQTGACRDDKLYNALYEDHGIGRRQVARLIAILKKKGSIHTPRARARP